MIFSCNENVVEVLIHALMMLKVVVRFVQHMLLGLDIVIEL